MINYLRSFHNIRQSLWSRSLLLHHVTMLLALVAVCCTWKHAFTHFIFQMIYVQIAYLRNPPPVSEAEARRMVKRINAFAYVECSAKTHEGVKEVFETAVRATRTAARSLRHRHYKCQILWPNWLFSEYMDGAAALPSCLLNFRAIQSL